MSYLDQEDDDFWVGIWIGVALLFFVGLFTVPQEQKPPGLFPPTTSPGVGPRVAIVGDSLTFAIEREEKLTSALQSRGYSTAISATAGARAEHLPLVTWPAPHPEVLVVALGSNGNDPLETMGHIDAHALQYPDACLVLVGINATAPSLALDAPALNAMLRSRADVFVDWASTAREFQEYLISDKVHLTPAGEDAYRQAFIDAVGDCNKD